MEVSFGVMLLYLTPQPDDDGDYDANAVDDALDDGGDDIGDVDDDNCYGFYKSGCFAIVSCLMVVLSVSNTGAVHMQSNAVSKLADALKHNRPHPRTQSLQPLTQQDQSSKSHNPGPNHNTQTPQLRMFYGDYSPKP